MATESVEDFDFGAAKAGLPEESVAPDGPYNLEIKKAEYKMSKGDPSQGKPRRPMFAITCHIVSGPFAGLPVWHNMVYTEENATAKRMFYAQLALLGISSPGTASQTSAALKGRVFQAQVGHRAYNGVPQNTIERIISLVSASPTGSVPQAAVPQVASPIPQPTPAVAVPEAVATAAVPPVVAPVPAPQVEAPAAVPAADPAVPKPPF